MFSNFTQWAKWGLFSVVVLGTLGSCRGNEDLSEHQQNETPNSEQVHSRQKRFVYFNTQSPVDIGKLKYKIIKYLLFNSYP